MINDARWNLSRVSQFISRRGEDCEHVQAQNANEDDADSVNRLAMNSDGAEDEIEIIEIMNTGLTLGSRLDESASVVIRQRKDTRTSRLHNGSGKIN